MLRRYRVPYIFKYSENIKLDRIDIVKVQTNPLFRRKGLFTRFLDLLTVVCNDIHRVVYIECVIGKDFQQYIDNRNTQFYTTLENCYIYAPSIKYKY
jgi:hypothetical protein